MKADIPEYLKSGERARLFPVLSVTSKEGRATAILLSCLSKVHELGQNLLGSVGQKVGVRSDIKCYTEVVFKSEDRPNNDRPDGLIVLTVGKKRWSALIEAKIGNAELNADQLERYVALAKENKIDAVITVSNRFAATPQSHPITIKQRGNSKIELYHWSWMHVLTIADLLLSNEAVADGNQRQLLNELRRFLSHHSTGIRGFDRMPSDWSDLVKLCSSGGRIASEPKKCSSVIDAWHQEMKDLALILSRQTETLVQQRLSRGHLKDATLRKREDTQILCESEKLLGSLDVPDAAAPVELNVDVRGRSISAAMKIRAPEDKKSNKARLTWLFNQLRGVEMTDVVLLLHWPGRKPPTFIDLDSEMDSKSLSDQMPTNLVVHTFEIALTQATKGRFGQTQNFITDVETIVPKFYREIGSKLQKWQRLAPKVREDKATKSDVDTQSISEDAEELTFAN